MGWMVDEGGGYGSVMNACMLGCLGHHGYGMVPNRCKVVGWSAVGCWTVGCRLSAVGSSAVGWSAVRRIMYVKYVCNAVAHGGLPIYLR